MSDKAIDIVNQEFDDLKINASVCIDDMIALLKQNIEMCKKDGWKVEELINTLNKVNKTIREQ